MLYALEARLSAKLSFTDNPVLVTESYVRERT